VERLLEGFAFLTGRIREKLDDEFPQLTQSLINVLWPHYLRPIPAASILEFTPKPGMIRETRKIDCGTEILSTPVDGTHCRFRTCFDVCVHPFEVESISIESKPGELSKLRLRFHSLPGVDITKLQFETLQFYLADSSALDVYLWLCQHVQEVWIQGVGSNGK